MIFQAHLSALGISVSLSGHEDLLVGKGGWRHSCLLTAALLCTQTRHQLSRQLSFGACAHFGVLHVIQDILGLNKFTSSYITGYLIYQSRAHVHRLRYWWYKTCYWNLQGTSQIFTLLDRYLYLLFLSLSFLVKIFVHKLYLFLYEIRVKCQKYIFTSCVFFKFLVLNNVV